MSDEDSELGSFLAGFVIGGLVGAAVALVLAPQSGSETRSQITGKGQEMQQAGERTVAQATETADAYAQRMGERVTQFGQEVEQQARIVLDAGRQGSKRAEDNGASASSGVEDDAGSSPAD